MKALFCFVIFIFLFVNISNAENLVLTEKLHTQDANIVGTDIEICSEVACDITWSAWVIIDPIFPWPAWIVQGTTNCCTNGNVQFTMGNSEYDIGSTETIQMKAEGCGRTAYYNLTYTVRPNEKAQLYYISPDVYRDWGGFGCCTESCNKCNLNRTTTTTIPGELPIVRQPLSDYEELYNVFVKSEYETQAQYETRIKDFLTKEPLHFFDISYLGRAYDVETQTLTAYAGEDANIAGIPIVTFDVPGIPFEKSYRIAITNNAAFGITNYDSNYGAYILCKFKVDPVTAQALKEEYDRLKCTIGLHIPYKPQGIIYQDFSIQYNYYIIGELAVITIWDSSNNKIYCQDNHINSSWLPTTTTSIQFCPTTTTIPSGPCAAEAIYGEQSEQTELLRKYRDNVLSKTPEGQETIKTYYKFSPTITKLLEQMPLLKKRAKAFIDIMLPVIRRKVEERNKEP